MSADQWLALIPVVIVERALFAVGMVVAYKVINFVLNSQLNLNTLRYKNLQFFTQGERESNPFVMSRLRSNRIEP